MTRHTVATAAALLTASVACAQGDDVQRHTRQELDFAVDLHRQLPAGNQCVSPTSLSQALGLLYAGSGGETAAELARALRFDERTHDALAALRQALASRGRGAKAKDGQPFQLNVVNALWAQQGLQLEPAFSALAARSYAGALRRLDFRTDPEACRETINGWVAEHTADKIPELIPPQAIRKATRVVLTNAVYFNAAWAEQFEAAATQPKPFRLASAEAVTVPTMHQCARFPTAQGEGWRLVQLPYDGHQLSMVVIVPDDLAAFEAGLDGAKLAAVLASRRDWEQLDLALPRWSFRSQLELKEPLQALGVQQAFESQGADLSPMTREEPLFVSRVIHEVVVEVDERGTEAAAATAVLCELGAAAEPRPFIVDRPFLFLVQDEATGAVVFLGRVADPRG